MVKEGKDQIAIETELSDAWQIVQTFARLKFLATSNIRYLGRMLGQAELRKTIGYSGFSARTADSIYALPQQITPRLEDLCSKWSFAKNDVEESLIWTNSFLQIHPFVDMNGRVSRILLCALILNKFKAAHLSKNFVSGIFGTDAGRLAYIEANQRRVDFGDCNALRSLARKNLLTELIDEKSSD